jgi:subtilisin family serine protease
VALAPNDFWFGNGGMYGMQKISAPTAWDTTTGDPNIVVAVIDTGIRYTHEDLAPNMWQNPGEIAANGVDDDGNGYVDDYYGYDFNNNNGNPIDEYGHGTHCAGTIGAAGNNTMGVVGVNWNVRIMSLKIHNAQGVATSADVIEAFGYARMMKNRGVNIRVTNNSYGGCSESCGYDQATKDAIDAAGQAGILNVFAAGNNNSNNETTPFYPASYNSPSILAVSASDANDNRAGFSNYGAMGVDLAAPGHQIVSTFKNSDSNYAFANGTSMAAPHVAGAAALLLAANPNLSVASLKATLMNTVNVLPQLNGVVKTGGRLNLAQAIAQQTVCTFSASPNGGLNFPLAGGNGSISVATQQSCGYTGFPSANWITANPDEGNGSVFFTVSPNTTGSARQATLNIAGQTFTITQSALTPTAAKAEIKGRVLTETGRGAANVWLEISGGNLTAPVRVKTNSFGYYRFSEIGVGEMYVVSAESKRYSFEPATQTINLSGNVEGIDFLARQR